MQPVAHRIGGYGDTVERQHRGAGSYRLARGDRRVDADHHPDDGAVVGVGGGHLPDLDAMAQHRDAMG